MSIKIYEAYRFPARNLWKFIDLFNASMLRRAANHMRKVMPSFDPEKVLAAFYPDSEVQAGWKKQPDWERKMQLMNSFVIAMLASRKSTHFGNYDTSVNVWLDSTWAYAIPYLGCFLPSLRKLSILRSVEAEDYSYWNNSDCPRGISPKEWAAREKAWDKLALNKWNRRRLCHTVISGADYHCAGFDELQDAIIGKSNCRLVLSAWLQKEKELEEKVVKTV